jgi:3-methyl-2-oxobutanoate hydroxymethyltransferase
MILVGDSLGMTMLGYETTVPVTMEEMIHHIKPVVKGAPQCFVVGDLPFGSYNASIEDAIKNGTRLLKEAGADAVKLEGGAQMAPTVRALVDAGIPVMAHIGLTPQTISQLGDIRYRGKKQEKWPKVSGRCPSIRRSGGLCHCPGMSTCPIGRIITEKLAILTVGIGAGADCDGQVLVFHDLLGLFDRFTPKFVKRYANLGKTITEALSSYSKEVRSGNSPIKSIALICQRKKLRSLIKFDLSYRDQTFQGDKIQGE